MISPHQALIAVVLIIIGFFLFYAVNVDDSVELEPGASIMVQGSTMTVDIVAMDMSPGAVLNGDLSADIKRVEYRVNGGEWVSNTVNGSMWVPLDAANVTSFEVMGLRGDTLITYIEFDGNES